MVNKFTKWKILFPYLHDYQRSLILADFEKELERPHQTLKRYVEELVEEDILYVEERERYSSYRLNLENPFVFQYLSISEKLNTHEVLGESNLIRRLYEKTAPFFLQASFLVFGSYGVGREGNDVDLLLVGRKPEALEEALDEFGETYKEVHTNHIESEEELNPSFKKELLKKHIIFNGSDHFVRIFGDLYGKTGLV